MISLISGESVLHEEDFRLNGPIPLTWTRNYFTHVPRKTSLGETWHSNFDQRIRVDRKEYSFFWENGNLTQFESTLNDLHHFNPHMDMSGNTCGNICMGV